MMCTTLNLVCRGWAQLRKWLSDNVKDLQQKLMFAMTCKPAAYDKYTTLQLEDFNHVWKHAKNGIVDLLWSHFTLLDRRYSWFVLIFQSSTGLPEYQYWNATNIAVSNFGQIERSKLFFHVKFHCLVNVPNENCFTTAFKKGPPAAPVCSSVHGNTDAQWQSRFCTTLHLLSIVKGQKSIHSTVEEMKLAKFIYFIQGHTQQSSSLTSFNSFIYVCQHQNKCLGLHL